MSGKILVSVLKAWYTVRSVAEKIKIDEDGKFNVKGFIKFIIVVLIIIAVLAALDFIFYLKHGQYYLDYLFESINEKMSTPFFYP